MSTKPTTSSSSERMPSTKRRGPRYRSPSASRSVPYRGTVDDLVMAATGLSPAQAARLRFQWPSLIAKAIQRLREAGHIEAAAQLLAPIEEAGASQIALCLTEATLEEQEAEAACDVAETAAFLNPSPATEAAALRASAIERRWQTERDQLRRQRRQEREA